MDDFLGSGQSFIKYYKTFIEPQIRHVANINRQFILSVFHLERASKAIQKEYPDALELISELKYPAFSYKRSVFGYREKMVPIRQLAYKYGINLFSVSDRDTNKEKVYPLGYENSQALIIFPYNPPNNTLPIIWSSKTNWIPLIPRSSVGKIASSKAFRKKLAFELGLLRFTDLTIDLYSGSRDLGWKSFHFVTKTDFATFAILSMLKQKRAVPIICQELGISESDYQSYIAQGRTKDIFDDNGSITSHGDKIYLEAAKKLKHLKQDKYDLLNFDFKEINYVPKTFKGRA